MGNPKCNIKHSTKCNSLTESVRPLSSGTIHKFYTEASWIEGAAVDQLHHVASFDGVKQIAAFPDLHPGKYGPVGCAILADRIYPQFIGNDIGCGMSLFALDIPARKIKVDKAAQKLRSLEGPWGENPDEYLEQFKSDSSIPEELLTNPLGTIGGGNHFCELQSIGKVFDQQELQEIGLNKNQTLLLVHSGSRALGMHIFSQTLESFATGMKPGSVELDNYLRYHDTAVKWATLNRAIIAKRAATALRADCLTLADAPHNIVEQYDQGYIHRKGAAKADMPCIPLAGSRDALSFILKPTETPELQNAALYSLAHGSGRKYDRSSMKGRIGSNRSDSEKLKRTSFGGQVICDDKQLLIEEAPLAYKNPEVVLNDLVAAKLATPIASLKPLVTFKKATTNDKPANHNKHKRINHRRGSR